MTPTLTENNQKDGLEIRFPSKPTAAVLTRLKSAGWRWSRFSACWYTRRTPAARKFAEALIGQPGASPAPGRTIPETVAPEFRVKLAAVGAVCGKTPEQVYALWHAYAAECSAGDQSAIWTEFLEWKRAELKPAAPVIIVARYEDGETYRSPVDEWMRENTDDEECAAALPKILAGETVNVGGGAAPLVTLSVERPSAPANEDYPCSDLGYEDACREACGL